MKRSFQYILFPSQRFARLLNSVKVNSVRSKSRSSQQHTLNVSSKKCKNSVYFILHICWSHIERYISICRMRTSSKRILVNMFCYGNNILFHYFDTPIQNLNWLHRLQANSELRLNTQWMKHIYIYISHRSTLMGATVSPLSVANYARFIRIIVI